MSEPLLQVEHLQKTFEKKGKQFTALDDVSFQLYPGEILGMIGKNGSGKSTLLKVLSKIVALDSGKITYKGKLTSIIDIGTGFHPDLTGKQNVNLVATLLDSEFKQSQSFYESIVEFSGLKDFMDVPVKNYSSGMYLRLAFSIAFHSPINILLLDEVIAVGDSNFRNKCYNKINELKKRGVGIILVSHDMESIISFCDRSILINNGKIELEGDPKTICETYVNWDALENSSSLRRDFKEDEIFSESVRYHIGLPQNIADSLIFENFEIHQEELPFTIEDKTIFTFSFEVINEAKSVEVALIVNDTHGKKIFMDSYGMRHDYLKKRLEPGHYTATCEIPPDFMNLNFYRISVIININYEPVKLLENLATIKFVSKNPQFYDLMKVGSCAILPKLKWELYEI